MLGVSIAPSNSLKTNTVTLGQAHSKFIITIANSVEAAGISADYVCSGVNDNVQWQNALNALPASGGELEDLTGGVYNFSGTVTRAIPNVMILGTGMSTSFTGSTPDFTIGGNGWTFENLSVNTGGISVGSYAYVYNNVQVGSTVYNTSNPIVSAPTGRTSYVIAASDAPASVKAQADYTMPNSTADIGAVVNAAYGAGYYDIKLSENHFALSTTITLSGQNQTLEGVGAATIITPVNSANTDMILVSGGYSTVKQMFLLGNKTNQASGSGIKVSGSNRIRLTDLELSQIHDYGIWQSAGSNIFTNNIYVFQSGSDGYHFSGSGNNLQNCWAVGCGAGGFYTNSTETVCNQLWADLNTTFGVEFYNVSDSSATNITASNNLSEDILITTCNRFKLTSSTTIYNYATGRVGGYGAGIVLISSNNCSVIGNSVYSYPVDATNSKGIVVASYNGSTNCIVSDNDIYSEYGDLYADNASGHSHTGNVYTNNRLTGATPFHFSSAADEAYITANNTISGNVGFIATGETRTISGTLAGVTPAGIMTINGTAAGIDNPFGQTVRVMSVDVEVTTQGAASGTMDVGVGSSASADYNTMFNVLPCDNGTSYPYFFNSLKTATYGVQTNPIYWNTGSGNRYLNFYAHVANNGYAATYTITCMGN